jgi:hypothetical protein
MARHHLFLALPFLIASCDSPKSGTPATEASEIIEVLAHDEGKFTRSRSIPVEAAGSTFNVDGVEFTITHRWPHAETTRNVTDDGERLNHGIEVTSMADGKEHSQWVFQTDSDDTMSALESVGAMVRVTPPGARPPRKEDPSFAGQIQILWQGQLRDLPEVGDEVFEGWKLKSSKSYQHALMDDKNGVTESTDGGFTNRVFEIHITDDKGTEERHIAFLDHPEITRGIHPTILPVTRLSGDSASQSRLAVCSPVQPATEKHIVRVSPNTDNDGLTARVWLVGEKGFKTIPIEKLPADISLTDDRTLRLDRHFTHASAHVKWERRDKPARGEAKPALLIEHRASHYKKNDFVLIRNEVTPCRVDRKHLMLRFTNSPE